VQKQNQLLQVKYLLEYAMQRGARELDFTTGEEPYKYSFTNHARVNYAARAHAPLLFYGVDRLMRRAKAAAARSPAVNRLAKRVLKPWLGETLRRLGM